MAGYPPEQREKEADLLRRILHNQVAGGQRDWVLLNAGLLLYAGGRGASLAECTSLARRALEDGDRQHRKLESLSSDADGSRPQLLSRLTGASCETSSSA